MAEIVAIFAPKLILTAVKNAVGIAEKIVALTEISIAVVKNMVAACFFFFRPFDRSLEDRLVIS